MEEDDQDSYEKRLARLREKHGGGIADFKLRCNNVRYVVHVNKEHIWTGDKEDHDGRISIALLNFLCLGSKDGHFSQNNNSVMPENKPKISCEAFKEGKRKCTREGSTQTDEDVYEDNSHGCLNCKSTNARLAEIDEKLERLLKLTDELETYELNSSKMNTKACKKTSEVLKSR